MKLSLGKLNYWFGRLMVMGNRFLAIANFAMLLYITTQDQLWFVAFIPIGILISLGWIWFDRKRVVGKELETWFELNPRLVAMENDIKEIKECLNGKAK